MRPYHIRIPCICALFTTHKYLVVQVSIWSFQISKFNIKFQIIKNKLTFSFGYTIIRRFLDQFCARRISHRMAPHSLIELIIWNKVQAENTYSFFQVSNFVWKLCLKMWKEIEENPDFFGYPKSEFCRNPNLRYSRAHHY